MVVAAIPYTEDAFAERHIRWAAALVGTAAAGTAVLAVPAGIAVAVAAVAVAVAAVDIRTVQGWRTQP